MVTKAHPRMVTKNADVLSPKAYSATPTARADGTAIQPGDTAYSDGTSSTNGFGASGAGLYTYNGATWQPGSPVSANTLVSNVQQSIGATGAKNFTGAGSLLRRDQEVKTHFLVISRVTSAQPASPSEGDHYLLPASPTGAAWGSYSAGNIAAYTDGAWTQIAAVEGYTVDILDEDITLRYSGSAWANGVVTGPASSTANNVPKFGGTSGKTIVDSGISINALAVALGAAAASELTIASGAITLTTSSHTVDTESDAATDNLDSVDMSVIANGGFFALTPANASRVVTIRHGVGNYVSPNNTDFRLTGPALFMKSADGTSFTELTGSSTGRGIVSLDEKGAKGDAILLEDAVVTSGDATVTCASANWTSADIGKAFSAYKGKASGSTGPSGLADTYAVWHHTTIAAINSPTSIELASAPTASASLTRIVYGTNDDAAKAAAVDAINANGGGTLYATPGKEYYFGNQEDQFTTGNVLFLLRGATIHCPALTNNPNIAQSDCDWLFSTPGRTHEGGADGANLKATTTLTAAAKGGEISISVASATGILPGQFVDVNSTQALLSASSRGLFDRNRVRAVEGTTIYLEKEIAMDIPVTGSPTPTVTAKFYDMLDNITVEGGNIIAGGYAGDAANGGGQSCFFFQYIKNLKIIDVEFDGFMGFPIYPMFCVDVMIQGGGHVGRPPDIDYIEAKVSGWYYGYSQQSRNVTVQHTKSDRCRHHIDGGFCIGLNAYHNEIHNSRTSALRTHNGVVDFDFTDNRLHRCYQAIAHDGIRGRCERNIGTFVAAGILDSRTSGVTYNVPLEVFYENNKLRQVSPDDETLTGLSGRGMVVDAPYARAIIKHNDIVMASDNYGLDLFSSGNYQAAYMEAFDNTVSCPSTTTAGLIFGHSGLAGAVTGLIAKNSISAPLAAAIIDIDGPSSGSLNNFFVTDNFCPDATKTASTFVVESGNLGANYYEGNNYGPAFGDPVSGGGGGAWTTFTPNISFNNVDVAAGSHSVQEGRYRSSGDTTEFTSHTRLSSAAAGATTEIVRVEVPGLPTPAHDYAVSVISNAPALVGVAITGWYSASTNDIRLYDGAGNIIVWDDVDNDVYFTISGTFVE